MTRKWRILAWIIYTIGSFLLMLIGFDWKISLSLSIIIGFSLGLLNEITQLLIQINEKIKKD